MAKIWLEEMATKGSENWQGFWANMDYDKALREVRKDNREERKREHQVRYRIRDIILSETVKEVI